MSMNAQQFPRTFDNGTQELVAMVRKVEQDTFSSTQNVLSQVSDVVADLKAKQAALEQAQADLAAVVASQISIDGKTAGTAAGVVGVGAYTTMLTVTLTAPAWASRCVATASAVVGSTSMGGAAAGLWGRITVDGVASENFESVAQTGGESMNVTPLFMRVFDPGASVVVNLDTRATFGTAGTALARLVVSVSFTR